MHIKNIHCILEELADCAKTQIKKGIESVDTDEMGKVVDMIKDLAEAEYYGKISKAMEEAEYGEDYDYSGAYDTERRGYRRRNSLGRFVSKKGYEEMEHMRDMDRDGMSRMYSPSDSQKRDHREGRAGQQRKSYMEAKELHKGNTAEDKQKKMRELEAYVSELTNDVMEMINGATAEEKSILKTKMQTLAQKI